MHNVFDELRSMAIRTKKNDFFFCLKRKTTIFIPSVLKTECMNNNDTCYKQAQHWLKLMHDRKNVKKPIERRRKNEMERECEREFETTNRMKLRIYHVEVVFFLFFSSFSVKITFQAFIHTHTRRINFIPSLVICECEINNFHQCQCVCMCLYAYHYDINLMRWWICKEIKVHR